MTYGTFSAFLIRYLKFEFYFLYIFPKTEHLYAIQSTKFLKFSTFPTNYRHNTKIAQVKYKIYNYTQVYDLSEIQVESDHSQKPP